MPGTNSIHVVISCHSSVHVEQYYMYSDYFYNSSHALLCLLIGASHPLTDSAYEVIIICIPVVYSASPASSISIMY